MSDCCIGLELTKHISVYPVTGRPTAWRLVVEVSRWSGLTDPNVFLYRVHPGDYGVGDRFATFERVCSPVDFDAYPAGNPPDSDTTTTLFRLSSVDLLFRNEHDAEQAWEAIRTDRDELVRTAGRLCALEHATVDAYGCFEPESSSGSSSSEETELSSESAESEVPAADPVNCLLVTMSDDPAYPAGLVFYEDLSSVPPGARVWRAEAEDGSGEIVITTWLSQNVADYVVTRAGYAPVAGSEDMSGGYWTLLQYVWSDGVTHWLVVTGAYDCSSSSSGGA